jgi:hypothetical protein
VKKLFVDIHVPARKTPTPPGCYADSGLTIWARHTLAMANTGRDKKVIFSRSREGIAKRRSTL